MSLLHMSTGAHLAGSLILALFFVLLARHDPRPYLRDWTAAWIAQVLALGALLNASLKDSGVSLAFYVFLATIHGALIVVAAFDYARGLRLGPRHGALLAAVALWAGSAPRLFTSPMRLQAAQFAVLAACYLGAAARLWPLREPTGMGLRLTTNVLGLLGLLYAAHATVFAGSADVAAAPSLYAELALLMVLLLQMLLALGMVLAVMEAAQWALATTNAQLVEAERRLKVLAETDPLTGCFNRRVFRELVDDLRAGQGPQEGVVLLVDLDGLKAINDSRGHQAGDDAIRSVAAAIRSRTRDSDIVVRWGGDEFVVVIPGAGRAEGETRRSQVAGAVGATGFSASIGLAAYAPGTDILAAVAQADRGMYAVKTAKRGRA